MIAFAAGATRSSIREVFASREAVHFRAVPAIRPVYVIVPYSQPGRSRRIGGRFHLSRPRAQRECEPCFAHTQNPERELEIEERAGSACGGSMKLVVVAVGAFFLKSEHLR